MRARLTTLAVAGLILLSLGVAHAQDQEAADNAFREGQKAVEERRWAAAIAALQNAIKIVPAESSRKVRGWMPLVGGTEYLPHYFLGKAYFGQNDCANALDAWSRSEQAGVIQKADKRHLRDLQDGSRACEQKGFLPNARLELAAAGVTRQLEAARAAADEVASRARTEGDLFTTDRRNRLNQVLDEIKRAEGRLEAGRRSRAAAELNEASAGATRASAQAVALRTELTQLANARKTVQDALVDLDRAIDQGFGLERSIENKRAFLTDSLSAARQRGVQALANARRVAGAAKAAGSDASPGAVADARALVATTNAQLQRLYDDLVALENNAASEGMKSALRFSRERFRLADQAIRTFDARVKARGGAIDPALTAERQTIGQRLATGRRQLEEAATSGPVLVIEEAAKTADRGRTRLVEMTANFGPLTLEERGVDIRLVEATRLFLNGEYARVLTALQPAEPFPANMIFLEHVYVLRAAASFAQYLKTGGSDSSLEGAARAEIAALKALDPAFQPNPQAFSPRFIEFFRTVSAAVAPPAETATAKGTP